ncbi:MAG TPA: hypothetical protein VMV72_12660 [Verrucomicrobiae bacterium]|nr:hypothetical protein [Verrucomicrobiae bacterium]
MNGFRMVTVIVAALIIAKVVEAQNTNSWTDGSGKWENTADWSLGVAPSTPDAAELITNANTGTVTIDAATASNAPASLSISNLTVSAPPGFTNTLFLNNEGTVAPLAVLNTLSIDANGAVAVNHSAVQIFTNLFVGITANSATLTVTNGGAVSDANAYIGYTGWASDNSAVISDPGSVWSNSGTVYVGIALHGNGNQLIITNGGTVYSDNGQVGGPGPGWGTALVSGRGSVWFNNQELEVGTYYSGPFSDDSLTVADGGAAFASTMKVWSDEVLSYATVTGTGSVCSVSGELFIDGGAVTISDGAVLYSDGGWLDADVVAEVLVTDPGSVWDNSGSITFSGVYGEMTIANGGAVFSSGSTVSCDTWEGGGSIVVTGRGSVWSNSADLTIGANDGGGSLTIASGGAVYNANANLDTVGDGRVTVGVSGPGSVWENSGNLSIGNSVASSWVQLTISGGGIILASNIFERPKYPSAQNTITVSGGSLYVTNALGNGELYMSGGTLTLNGGTVTVDQLLLVTNGTGATDLVLFNGGLLNSGGTSVTNGSVFRVGDGTDAAMFHLLGGVHSFADNLEISNNATLAGCGTVSGNVVIDPGGTVLANCGGTLSFTGIVTNKGVILASGGTDIEFFGPVVNNGVMDALAGTVHFHSTFTNTGTFFNSNNMRITAVTKKSNDVLVTWTTVGGHSYVLQSTKSTAMIAGYNTTFVDVSPAILVSGLGPTATNYLDAGAAYAPVVTAPGGTMVTTSVVPSTVSILAAGTRGIEDSLSNALPIGSVVMLGTFSMSEPTIQSNFLVGNTSAIMSNFTVYGTPFKVGDGTGLPASWDTSQSAAGFGGQQIYVLATDKPALAAATHLGIYTAPSWVFPADGDEIDIDLADVTDFVIGAHGGSLTIGLPVGGETYTFTDTARLSVLPGRILFYRVRLAQ